MTTPNIVALQRELAEARSQLEDLAGEARTSPRLALKYWSLWRRARAERAAAIDERERAIRWAVRLDSENRRLEADLARELATAIVVQQTVHVDRPDGAPRTDTPPIPGPNGGRRITVKRSCNGCGRVLGDANETELEASVTGSPLPDVREECGCVRP